MKQCIQPHPDQKPKPSTYGQIPEDSVLSALSPLPTLPKLWLAAPPNAPLPLRPRDPSPQSMLLLLPCPLNGSPPSMLLLLPCPPNAPAP